MRSQALREVDGQSEREVREVLLRYGLENALLLGRTDAGIRNDNFVVRAGGSARYFLQGYRSDRDPEQVRFQVAFQEHLRASGFPTARAVPSASDELIVIVAGRAWVLSTFVEGFEYDFSRIDQAAEAGRMLARFHKIGQQFRASSTAFRAPGVGRADRDHRDSTFEAYFGRGLEQAALARKMYAGLALQRDVDFVTDWWLWFAKAWPLDDLRRLPTSYVHWDYHGRNVLFNGHRMAGLFDFEWVSRGPRAIDVARGLFNFGRTNRGLFGGGPLGEAARNLRPEFAHAFLDAYEAESPLSAEECQAVPVLAVFNFIPDLLVHKSRATEEDVLARFNREARLAAAVQREMERLAPEFSWQAR